MLETEALEKTIYLCEKMRDETIEDLLTYDRNFTPVCNIEDMKKHYDEDIIYAKNCCYLCEVYFNPRCDTGNPCPLTSDIVTCCADKPSAYYRLIDMHRRLIKGNNFDHNTWKSICQEVIDNCQVRLDTLQ